MSGGMTMTKLSMVLTIYFKRHIIDRQLHDPLLKGHLVDYRDSASVPYTSLL